MARPPAPIRLIALIGVALLAFAGVAEAQFSPFEQNPTLQAPKKKRVPRATTPRARKNVERERPLPAVPVDKRDRVVVAPGTPFHGRAYWLALAQCGGIYFKLRSFETDAVIRAKVIKPNPTELAAFTKKADAAAGAATWFFDAAERVLTVDRKIARDEAVLTYDPQANDAGDRLRTVEAAQAATKPCPALYQACHANHPVVCRENKALAAGS
jgi:hypothetical protein